MISVKLHDPQFEGQTKTKLGNPPIKGLVEETVNRKLGEYLEENPGDARRIITKAVEASRARDAARKARDLTRRKSALEKGGQPGAPYKPLAPDRLYLSPAEWAERLGAATVARLTPFAQPDGAGRTVVDLGGRQGRAFAAERAQEGEGANVFDAAVTHIRALQGAGKRVILAAWSDGSRERLAHVLADHGQRVPLRHVLAAPLDVVEQHALGARERQPEEHVVGDEVREVVALVAGAGDRAPVHPVALRGGEHEREQRERRGIVHRARGRREVDAGTLELRAKKQLRIGNDDGVRGDVACMDRFGKKVRARVMAQSVGNLGVELAEVIHPATAMVNK